MYVNKLIAYAEQNVVVGIRKTALYLENEKFLNHITT